MSESSECPSVNGSSHRKELRWNLFSCESSVRDEKRKLRWWRKKTIWFHCLKNNQISHAKFVYQQLGVEERSRFAPRANCRPTPARQWNQNAWNCTNINYSRLIGLRAKDSLALCFRGWLVVLCIYRDVCLAMRRNVLVMLQSVLIGCAPNGQTRNKKKRKMKWNYNWPQPIKTRAFNLIRQSAVHSTAKCSSSFLLFEIFLNSNFALSLRGQQHLKLIVSRIFFSARINFPCAGARIYRKVGRRK